MMGSEGSIPAMSEAYNIISLLSNPTGFQSKLDILAKQTEDYQAISSSVSADRKAAEDAREEADKAYLEASKLKEQTDELVARHTAIQTSLEERERDLTDREGIFRTSSESALQALSSREANVSAREQAVSQREADLISKQAEIDLRNKDSEQLKVYYEDKLAKLKQLI